MSRLTHVPRSGRWPRPLSRRRAVVLAAAAATATARPPASVAADATPPNVVLVLTDDLSWNLVQYMPQVKQMQAQGMTFTNYVVTDSLCCPSRSSIFTGRFPH